MQILRAIELMQGNRVTFIGMDRYHDLNFDTLMPFDFGEYRDSFHEWADRNMYLVCRGLSRVPYRPYRFDHFSIVFEQPEDAMMAFLGFK